MSPTSSSRQVWIACALFMIAGCADAKVESAPGSEPPGGPGGGTGTGSPPAGSPGMGGPGFVLPETPPTANPGAGGAPSAGMPVNPGSTPGETCAAKAFTPEKVPVDIHILVDSSLSMGLDAGGMSKWDRAKQAMQAFVTDPKSAALGVGLTFFPNRTATNINTCRIDYYTTPAVPIAPLPMNETPMVTAIGSRALWGDTATRPALEGTLMSLRAHAANNPDRRPVLLLVTDGLPNGCLPGNTIEGIAEFLTAARTGTPSIATYAIGVFGNADRAMGELALNSWAAAGGSGMPFVLSANQDLGQRLLDALNEIRGEALGCQFAVPANMPGIDFGKVNVRLQSAAGSQEIAYVRSADRCDPATGGWYYDVDPATGTPTRVIICESLCRKYKPDTTAKVDLLFGCKTRTID
jgi:hypothetical protein